MSVQIREITRNQYDITFGSHRLICNYVGKNRWELLNTTLGGVTVHTFRGAPGPLPAGVGAWVTKEYTE